MIVNSEDYKLFKLIRKILGNVLRVLVIKCGSIGTYMCIFMTNLLFRNKVIILLSVLYYFVIYLLLYIYIYVFMIDIGVTYNIHYLRFCIMRDINIAITNPAPPLRTI